MSTAYYQQAQTFHALSTNQLSVTQAWAGNNLSGDLLVCLVCWGPSTAPVVDNTISSVTDNAPGGSNLWLPFTQITLSNSSEFCQLWYCLSCKASTSAPTVTAAFTGLGITYPQVSLVEYVNTGGTTLAVDQRAQNFSASGANSSSLSSGATGTLAQSGEICICYGCDYSQLNFTQGGSWNSRPSGASVVGCIEDRYSPSTAAITGTWTVSASSIWACGVVTFSSSQLPPPSLSC